MQVHTSARAECIGRVALDRAGLWSSDIPTTPTMAEFIAELPPSPVRTGAEGLHATLRLG
jgi:hypothetical protein